MPEPFSVWGKLVKDCFSLFTEHYNAEVCFTSTDCKFSEFKTESIDFREFCPVLLTRRPSVVIGVIQTLVNSWSTSRRLHEPKIHRCWFFGEWGDDMPHYLNCSVLWSLIFSLAKMNKDILSVPPEIRIGLADTNPEGMKLLACAFSVYHAIKPQHLEVALLAHSDSDLLPLVQLIFKLAQFHLSYMNFSGRTSVDSRSLNVAGEININLRWD